MATRQPNRAAQRAEAAKGREVVYQVGPGGIPVEVRRPASGAFVPTGRYPDYAQRQLAGAPPGLYDANGYAYNRTPHDYKVGNAPGQNAFVYEVDPWGKLHSYQTDEWGTNLIPKGAPGPDYNAERLAGAPPGYYRADGVGLYRTQTFWPGESKWNDTYQGAPGGPHAPGAAPPQPQALNLSAAPGLRAAAGPMLAQAMNRPAPLQQLVQMHAANQAAQGVRQAPAPAALSALAQRMTATMTRTPTSANLGGGRSLF